MKILTLCMTVFCLANVAHAESLADKQKAAEGQKELAKWTTETVESEGLIKKKCGFAIPTTFDGAGFAKAGFVEANRNAGALCAAAHQAVRQLCDDKVAKPVVQEKIKKISCKAGTAKDQKFDFSGGEFSATIGPDTPPNLTQHAKEFLSSKL